MLINPFCKGREASYEFFFILGINEFGHSLIKKGVLKIINFL
jgi:hypothetical protein